MGDDVRKQVRLILGRNIKRKREELGFSKVELAQQLSEKLGKNINSSAFTNWEQGIYSPDISILPILAELLGVEVSELMSSTMGEIIANKQVNALPTNTIVVFGRGEGREEYQLEEEQLQAVKTILKQFKKGSKNDSDGKY